MRIWGYLMIALGATILIAQIIQGEVCIGRVGRICIPFAEDPKRFWRWFFLYPSLSSVFGIFLARHARKPNLHETLSLIVLIGAITMIGVLIGSIYV